MSEKIAEEKPSAFLEFDIGEAQKRSQHQWELDEILFRAWVQVKDSERSAQPAAFWLAGGLCAVPAIAWAFTSMALSPAESILSAGLLFAVYGVKIGGLSAKQYKLDAALERLVVTYKKAIRVDKAERRKEREQLVEEARKIEAKRKEANATIETCNAEIRKLEKIQNELDASAYGLDKAIERIIELTGEGEK